MSLFFYYTTRKEQVCTSWFCKPSCSFDGATLYFALAFALIQRVTMGI